MTWPSLEDAPTLRWTAILLPVAASWCLARGDPGRTPGSPCLMSVLILLACSGVVRLARPRR
ncbi:hypothetical protein [Methylobacterium currus]|nr:hypothetical protein [Methylobacterium currus]